MEPFRFEDLFITCANCDGAGSIDDETARRRAQAKRLNSWESGPCNVCGGTGGQLTESGRALKKFLEQMRRSRVL